MGDEFSLDTNEMTTIANAIQHDTDDLEKQSDSLMGQLDDAYLNFPPGIANQAQISQISLNAVFKRVRTEDSRVSEILHAVVQEIEKLENELTQAFTPHK